MQLLTVALQTGVLIITEDSQEDGVLKPTSNDAGHWLGNLLASTATIDHTTDLASMVLSHLLTIEWLLHTKEYRTHESVLRPLIEHWQSLPRTVAPELRPDRIMPSKLFGRWPTGSKTDQHFLDLAALADQTALRSTVPEGHLVLPEIDLLPQDRAIVPTALLALYDALAPTGSGNGAAPIALRLFVEAVQALPLEDRGDSSAARMQLPLEHLRWRLWPNPNSHISIERLRSDLFDALDVLDRLWLPWQDPETGKGGDWRVVLGRNIGRSWDGDLTLDVALPPGSRNGPILPPDLHIIGSRSGLQYRILLNVSAHFLGPGRKHRPVGHKRYWSTRITRTTSRYCRIATCWPWPTRWRHSAIALLPPEGASD